MFEMSIETLKSSDFNRGVMPREVSEEAMVKASGHGREHWYPILDEMSKQYEKRSDLTKSFHEAYADSVSAWWCQMITVQWERDRGKRVLNESCTGSFQVSASKTMVGDAEFVWAKLLTSPWLENADFSEGAEFESGSARAVVRAARPDKMLRIWWYDHADNHKSVIEVSLWPSGEKTSLRFRHHELPLESDVESMRARWKEALVIIAENN